MTAPVPLSVFIITRNEARKIGEVVAAAREIASEVLVIDSGSTDATVEIATANGAKVIHNPWPGYGAQKRFGEDACRNDFVLNLDGDEVLPPDLRAEIKRVLAGPAHKAYQLRIMAHPPYGGGPWRFNYIDRIRLYDRREVRFPDHPTWDAIAAPKGMTVGVLKAPVHHFWMADFEHQIDKMNRYTSALAKNVPEKSAFVLSLRLIFGFPLDFLKAYLFRGHVFGGRYGFAVAMLYAFMRLARTVKMLERQLPKS
jgi:glycosyltransferase involved in cell wall biosynthesis